MDDKQQPIFLKRIKKAGHAHHGGAWKVAMADFAIALMAFFMVMWLLGSASVEQKAAISSYFNNPSLSEGRSQVAAQGQTGPGGASTSMILLGGTMELPSGDGPRTLAKSKDDNNTENTGRNNKNKNPNLDPAKETQKDAPKPEPKDVPKNVAPPAPKDVQKNLSAPPTKDNPKDQNLQKQPGGGGAENKQFKAITTQFYKSINKSPLAKFKDQVLMDMSPEGMRIQLIDREQRPMFDAGSSHLKEYAHALLIEIAKTIATMPSKFIVSGHTDAAPFLSRIDYSNWELSSDRANAARRALLRGGVSETDIVRVVGLSSSELLDAENPTNPANRRITIVLLNQQAVEALAKLNKPPEIKKDPVVQAPPPPDTLPALAPKTDTPLMKEKPSEDLKVQAKPQHKLKRDVKPTKKTNKKQFGPSPTRADDEPRRIELPKIEMPPIIDLKMFPGGKL